MATQKKATKEAKAKDKEKEEVGEIEMVPGDEHKVKQMPIVDHKRVTEILEDGRETKDSYHCRLEDGSTTHVPKTLFE